MGNLKGCLGVISLLQCIKQAQWPEDNPVLALAGMVQRDGTPHEYARKSMEQLLQIPQSRLDQQLPREVFLSPTYLIVVSPGLGGHTPTRHYAERDQFHIRNIASARPPTQSNIHRSRHGVCAEVPKAATGVMVCTRM